MRCKICGKPVKENTEGNKRYCQGHSILSVAAFEEREIKFSKVNSKKKGDN